MEPKLKTDEPVRLNLEVRPELRQQMELLQKKTGAASLTEVIRQSLVVYENALKTKKEGKVLVVRDKGGVETEIIIVF